MTYEELKAHYVAVRKRLGGLGKSSGLIPMQKQEEIPVEVVRPQEPVIEITVWELKGYPRNNFYQFLVEVAKKHNIDPHILVASTRKAPVVWIRREVVYKAHKELNYSQSQIGRWLKKDHTTINHDIQMWEQKHHVSA